MKTMDRAEVERSKGLMFLINAIPYAIPIGSIREIIYYIEATPLPEAPSFIEGVIDLRGMVVPVIDLKKKIGMKSQAKSLPDHILILKLRNTLVGIIVDEVKEVFRFGNTQIQEPQRIHRGPGSIYLTGVCKIHDQLVFLLDLDSLITSEEQIELGEIES